MNLVIVVRISQANKYKLGYRGGMYVCLMPYPSGIAGTGIHITDVLNLGCNGGELNCSGQLSI